jgi:hypothetical protein
MSMQRRQVLQILSYAFGAGFILPRNSFATAAQALRRLPAPGRQLRQPQKPNRKELKWKK